jgi:hypothetical protein
MARQKDARPGGPISKVEQGQIKRRFLCQVTTDLSSIARGETPKQNCVSTLVSWAAVHHKAVMLRACDLFDFLVFCTPHHKTVILSEAPRGSIT